LKRDYANRGPRHKRTPSERRERQANRSISGTEIQLPLDRDELLAVMQTSLDGLAVELGLLVASAILEDEVTRLCGKRYERQPGREHTRYGHQRGVATLAGQKLPIERPRVRNAHGGGEVPLETYARLQSGDAMPQAVLRRMVRGVSTRDYEEVIDTAREGFGVARSCEGHVPEKYHAELGRRLSEAYDQTAYATAKTLLEGTVRRLERINPVAASSLREGLEETLTVVKLGLSGVLRRTLATTNPIESALSVTRRVTARVTRWRDGDMRRRWCVAGLLRAESKFKRVKGYRAMPTLLKALDSIAQKRGGGNDREVA